jgi:hypothetical protein
MFVPLSPQSFPELIFSEGSRGNPGNAPTNRKRRIALTVFKRFLEILKLLMWNGQEFINSK